MKKPVAYQGDNKYIFISYSHKDDELVYPFIYKLQEYFNVWYDGGIETAGSWDKVVSKKLKDSTAVVFFVSNNSLSSEYCLDETIFAKTKKIPIIIIILREFTFSNQDMADYFEMYFGRIHHIKQYLHSSFEETMQEIYMCQDVKMAKRDSCIDNEKTTDQSTKQKPDKKDNIIQPDESPIKYYGGKPIIIHGAQTIFNNVSISMKDGNPYSINGKALKTTNRQIIHLDSCLGTGTYGAVYSIQRRPDIVAKVFFTERLKKRVQEKIELMVNSEVALTNKHITWPIEALYDDENNFVGYTMNNLTKKSTAYISLNDILKDNELASKLKKTDLIDIALSLLRNISRLHRENIVLGYLDVNNFCIRKENITAGKFDNLYISSSESFQIDIFPCRKLPKYRSYFPPEYNELRFKNYYLEYSWDYYVTFVILYQIFFRKICPYYANDIQTKDHVELTKIARFPYSLDFKETSKLVDPELAHIWSHLPSYIKEMFINSAKKGASHYYPPDRYTEKDWGNALLRYKEDIANGFLKSVDDEYNVAYPKNEIDYNLVNFRNNN